MLSSLALHEESQVKILLPGDRPSSFNHEKGRVGPILILDTVFFGGRRGIVLGCDDVDVHRNVTALPLDFPKGGEKIDASLDVLLGHGIRGRDEGVDLYRAVDFIEEVQGSVGQTAELLGGGVYPDEVEVVG